MKCVLLKTETIYFKIINKRRLVGRYYNKILSNIPELQILTELNKSEDVYQLYSVLMKNPNKRNELQEYLLKRGIYTKIYFAPIHLKSFYRKKFGYKVNDLPITEKIAERIITLPFSPNFSTNDQDYIVNQIKSFFNL